MPFGYAQDLVHRFNPVGRDALMADDRLESLSQHFAKTYRPTKQRVGRLRVSSRKREQVGAAFGRDDMTRFQKADEFVPAQFMPGRTGMARSVGKIDSEATAEECGSERGVSHLDAQRCQPITG